MQSKRATATTAAPKTTEQRGAYQKPVRASSVDLKESVGLLLLGLQGPLSRQQRNAGYRLLRILLAARYSEGTA